MAAERVRKRRTHWFRLAALAAATHPGSLDVLARRVSAAGSDVSKQPVAEFLEQDFDILAARTLAIKSPASVGLHVELLLFHRPATNIAWFVKQIGAESVVSRVDELDGYYNVIAEATALSRDDVSELVARFEADERLVLVSRSDSLDKVLMTAATRSARSHKGI